MTQSGYVAVAQRAELKPGRPLAVDLGGQTILLCAADDTVHAIENRCSHAEAPLDCGRIRLGWISCPAHGARFDLATGEALGLPASAPIRTYPVRIVGETIELCLD
jgi:3-phenylpropionate/trans-cinnamate dioxygenase ferredoxin subunit